MRVFAGAVTLMVLMAPTLLVALLGSSLKPRFDVSKRFSSHLLSSNSEPFGQTANIGDKIVSTKLLQEFELTNFKNERVRVGDLMGSGKSVVVFLRHLG